MPLILLHMEDTVKALLHAIGYLNLTIPIDGIVVMDGWHPLYSNNFPMAKFITSYAGQNTAWTTAGHSAFVSGAPIRLFLLHLPQQSTEADYAIASALSHMDQDGVLIVVADNQTGGKTLTKRLAGFGCPVQDLSKHKCRVVWTKVPQEADKDVISDALRKGDIHARATDGVYTQTGVFSWDHLDIGTQVLLQHLPQNLSGKGADFGCGVGDISRNILQQNPAITSLTCIDHDQRAVTCCGKNLAAYAPQIKCVWQDIPADTHLEGLDFIVMNPPFHKGKTEDKDLGKAFITKAAKALRTGGKLYMVANAHLPYEDVLRSLFAHGSVIATENGFKVFEAIR